MKKTFVRITSMTVVVVLLAVALVSCGGLSGKYESASLLNSSIAFTFKGSKVTLDITVLGTVSSVEGTYKIDGDKITLTYDSDNEEADKYEGSFSFEKGEDYIKIGGVKYTKAD